MAKWISVKDRMPSKGYQFAVIMRDPVTKTLSNTTAALCCDLEGDEAQSPAFFTFDGSKFHRVENAIYWLELPPIPIVKEDIEETGDER